MHPSCLVLGATPASFKGQFLRYILEVLVKDQNQNVNSNFDMNGFKESSEIDRIFNRKGMYVLLST